MRSRISLMLTLAVALAAFLAMPGSAHAARGMEVAIQDDPVFLSGAYYNRERALAQAKQLNVTRMRVSMIWSRVVSSPDSKTKPANVTYNFREFDDLIDAAARYGIRLQVTFIGSAPAWATGNRKRGNYSPNPARFAELAAAAAAHFKGRVDRYAIWNEPNWYTWLQPHRKAPKIYRALYSGAYTSIKRADPKAKVFFGETAPYKVTGRSVAPLKFVRDVLCAKKNYKKGRCKGLKTDGFSHHAYGFGKAANYKWPKSKPDDVTLPVISRLYSALTKLRKSKLLSTPKGKTPEIYVSEYGWFGSGPRKLSATKQAQYLRQGFDIAAKAPHVKQLLQYLLVRSPSKVFAFFDTSIVSLSGKPFKAFNYLKSWAAKAAKKRMILKPKPFTPAPRRSAAAVGPVAPPPPPPSGGGGSGGGTAPPPSCTSPLGLTCV